jgi:2-polyprenyl-6-methoxyphenol hydroxylase-like FAD-dependent oxidoreductase
MKKVVIIGAGIGGLGAAGLFAKKGYDVRIFSRRMVSNSIWGRRGIWHLTSSNISLS